ncbi:MAG: alpha-L-fucosidase [Anaerolineales bacterium]|jgi:alpha-L-fucosidase
MTDFNIESGPFEPTWESLRRYQCPDWFRDAKFGIWSHWGPQSVPMYGDWYAQNMYVEGSDQYRYHLRKYGHPSRVGWKDVVKLWKAEKFDPDGLMDLYVRAGAKYFVAQAAHHDNFHNWNSNHHRWNSVNMGPGLDIIAFWAEAARKRGLPYGFSEHIGASFNWYKPTKGADKSGPYAGVPYDGNDPAYEDFYLPNRDAPEWNVEWYTKNPWWHEKWYLYVKELIDLYQPDFLYSDGGVPFDSYGLHAIAHLYNTSTRLHGGTNQAVYTQKDRNAEVFKVGVLDIERSQLPQIFPSVWQTDTSVGDWFYNLRDVYKTPAQITETLVDIVSKNGNLLLNIPQLPDGTLDEECVYILGSLAKWMKVNGEGIYGTRPWTASGEGPSQVVIEGFKEDAVQWTLEDFRFTAKGNQVYAFQMKWPEGGKSVIRSLAKGKIANVTEVKVLGSDAPFKFEQTSRGLALDLPELKPTDFVQCYRVSLE